MESDLRPKVFELLRNDIYEQLHKSGLVVFKLLVDGSVVRLRAQERVYIIRLTLKVDLGNGL
ncbi:MAG: hypothetical protein J7L11_03395 [Thermoprotei archaeon]|nr:hypothetical protein [Thermoprotei archaeon]